MDAAVRADRLADVLVHVDDDVLARGALELGAALAAQAGGSVRAIGVVRPARGMPALAAETAALMHQAAGSELTAREDTLRGLVGDVARRAGRPIAFDQSIGEPAAVLRLGARCTDLLLVSQAVEGEPGGLPASDVAAVVVGAGCPVLVVPHIGWGTEPVAEAHGASVFVRVMVAWTPARECARALRDALPLLARATQVELVHFDDAAAPPSGPDVDDATAWLARHRIAAVATRLHGASTSVGERMRRAWIPDASVAEALLSHAADTHAELIVMGACGHSRLREFVTGGVTRTMLQTMTVPVLMSH